MTAEGWYIDTFGNHEARWISDGSPTALVRDGKVESQDPPPDDQYSGPFERVAQEGGTNSDDLLRADDAEAASADPDYGQAGAEAINKMGIPNF
jgi:hypothetical protein